MDQRLMNDFELIAYHPMQNDATTAISNADMKKVIAISGREAEVVDFTKLVVSEGGVAEEKKAGGAPHQKAAKHEKKEEVKQDVH